MKAIPLESRTRRLGAPTNWDESTQGVCHSLDIVDTDDGYMISAWQPTEAELQRLNEGKPLLLWIGGTSHPVVALTVAGDA